MKKVLFLIAVCFASAFAFAEIVPSAKTETIDDFSGGMNTHVNSLKLKNEYSPFISNWYVDKEIGKLVKIKGFSILGSSSAISSDFGVTLLKIFKRDSQQDEFILSDGLRVFSTMNFSNYQLIKSGLTQSAGLLSCAQIFDKMWFTNGVDPVFTYDGSTVAVLNGSLQAGIQTPNVPRGKYVAFQGGRVFIANSTDSASSVDFSEVFSTDSIPVTILPDNYLAWPFLNRFYVNKGDGYPISAMWSYNSRLFFGKENSVHWMTGTNSASFTPQRTSSNLGPVSNDSVCLGDNLTYFKAKNAICAFNGESSVRLTDAISEEMANVNDNIVGFTELGWDTNEEFNTGKFYGMTSTGTGVLQVAVTGYFKLNSIAATEAEISANRQFVSSNTLVYSSFTPTQYFPPNFRGYVSSIRQWEAPVTGGTLYFRIKNMRTGEEGGRANLTVDIPAFPTFHFFVQDMGFNDTTGLPNLDSFGYLSPFFTGADILSSTMSIRYTMNAPGEPTIPLASNGGAYDAKYYVHFPSMTNSMDVSFRSDYNNAYVSAESTTTALTGWDFFDASYNANGGQVSFFVKTATSLVNLRLLGFSSISPGSIINAPSSHTFVQWAASATTVGGLQNYPTIDRVSLRYKIGGTPQNRPISAFYDDRLWVSVSTAGGNQSRLIYVKSKLTNTNPNAWIRIDGVNLNSMLSANGSLYGGSSTSAAVMQLDTGYTFGGSTITARYWTPEFTLNDSVFKKDVLKYVVDAEPLTGGVLRVASMSNGVTSSTGTASLSGQFRVLREVNKPTSYPVRTLRLILMNDDVLGEVKLNGLTVYYMNTQIF